MNLVLNWVDWVILGTLLFFAFGALGRPLLSETLDLASFLLGFFLSLRFYNMPAKLFEMQFKVPHGLSLVLGFMAVWFFAEVLFFILVRLFLPKLPKIPGSKIFSVIPAVARGLVFIALFLLMLATFPIQPSIKKNVLDSKLGSQILKYAYNLESPVKSVFGGVTNDTLTFLTIKPKGDEKVNLGFQTSQTTPDLASENAMFSLVNNERLSRGLKGLTLDTKLRDIGRRHSKDMFERGYFAHFTPEGKTVADRALQANVDFLVIGENLAFAPSLELAHKGLMNSEGHRANILSEDYGRIGIGVMDGGIYGKMFTQIFTGEQVFPQALGISGERALVSKVVDGDTIIINDKTTVRFIGIDTPETVDPRRPVGCFGKEASSEVKNLLSGKSVILERDISDKDNYGRILRYIYLPLESGTILFINDYLVREGFARVLTYPPDVKFDTQLREAESQAKQDKKGLWGNCGKLK